jgi:hypothetical protein
MKRIIKVKRTSLIVELLKKKEACRCNTFILQRRTQKDKHFDEIMHFFQTYITNYSYRKSGENLSLQNNHYFLLEESNLNSFMIQNEVR